MQIITEHISCVCFETEFPEVEKQNFSCIYVLTKDGIMKHAKLNHGRYIRVKVAGIPELAPVPVEMEPGKPPVAPAPMGEEMKFLPAGKIPIKLFDEIIQFFKAVMEVLRTEDEAMAHILWNKEKGYHIGIPTQKVSKASVNYVFDHINPGDVIVVDIHSHNTMGAFFSGTDNNDDRRMIGFSGVVGKLKDREPETKWRFNIMERNFEVKMEDIFEVPAAKAVDIPQDWLSKVEVSKPHWGKFQPTGHSSPYPYPVGYQHGVQAARPRSESKSAGNGWGKTGWKDYPEDPAINDLWAGNVPDATLEPEEHAAWASIMGEYGGEKKSGGGSTNVVPYRPGARASLPATEEGAGDDGEFDYPFANGVSEGAGDGEARSDEWTTMACEHGPEAADAFEQIEVYLQDLSGADELLIVLMSEIYGMLSSDGQGRLSQNGF